jgi:hypothetical protein
LKRGGWKTRLSVNQACWDFLWNKHSELQNVEYPSINLMNALNGVDFRNFNWASARRILASRLPVCFSDGYRYWLPIIEWAYGPWRWKMSWVFPFSDPDQKRNWIFFFFLSFFFFQNETIFCKCIKEINALTKTYRRHVITGCIAKLMQFYSQRLNRGRNTVR